MAGEWTVYIAGRKPFLWETRQVRRKKKLKTEKLPTWALELAWRCLYSLEKGLQKSGGKKEFSARDQAAAELTEKDSSFFSSDVDIKIWSALLYICRRKNNSP